MWAKSRIDWATPLEQLSPGYEPVWRTPPPKSVPRVRTAWWLTEAHVRALVGPLLQEAPRTAMPSARCGLFGVQKVPKQVLRVIFDARLANEYLKPRGEQLVLFTVAMLMAAVSAYPFITSVDYRHFYYQFAIPLTLAWLFLIVFDVGGKYLPKVLPMGFREAVCIAQVASWVIVLHHHPDQRHKLEQKLGLPPEMLDRLFKLPAMPAFVTLQRDGKEVGRVFVLLDGVFVVCADEQLRNNWTTHLRNREEVSRRRQGGLQSERPPSRGPHRLRRGCLHQPRVGAPCRYGGRAAQRRRRPCASDCVSPRSGVVGG